MSLEARQFGLPASPAPKIKEESRDEEESPLASFPSTFEDEDSYTTLDTSIASLGNQDSNTNLDTSIGIFEGRIFLRAQPQSIMEHDLHALSTGNRKRSRADDDIKEEPLSDTEMPPRKKFVAQRFQIVDPGLFSQRDFPNLFRDGESFLGSTRESTEEQEEPFANSSHLENTNLGDDTASSNATFPYKIPDASPHHSVPTTFAGHVAARPNLSADYIPLKTAADTDDSEDDEDPWHIQTALEAELLKHVHNEEKCRFRCKIPGCSKLLTTRHSWRKHVAQRHSAFVNQVKQGIRNLPVPQHRTARVAAPSPVAIHQAVDTSSGDTSARVSTHPMRNGHKIGSVEDMIETYGERYYDVPAVCEYLMRQGLQSSEPASPTPDSDQENTDPDRNPASYPPLGYEPTPSHAADQNRKRSFTDPADGEEELHNIEVSPRRQQVRNEWNARYPESPSRYERIASPRHTPRRGTRSQYLYTRSNHDGYRKASEMTPAHEALFTRYAYNDTNQYQRPHSTMEDRDFDPRLQHRRSHRTTQPQYNSDGELSSLSSPSTPFCRSSPRPQHRGISPWSQTNQLEENLSAISKYKYTTHDALTLSRRLRNRLDAEEKQTRVQLGETKAREAFLRNRLDRLDEAWRKLEEAEGLLDRLNGNVEYERRENRYDGREEEEVYAFGNKDMDYEYGGVDVEEGYGDEDEGYASTHSREWAWLEGDGGY
jgi:hypothetical protein